MTGIGVLVLLGALLYYGDWSAWWIFAPLFALIAFATLTDSGETDPSHEIGQD